MIIKYIELTNFRQFKGKSRIDFSIDPDKKATLVLAENAAGKTTILDGFYWTLYGKTTLKTIINADIAKELEPLKNEQISGEICLIHTGTEYKIARGARIYKQSKSSKAKVGDVMLSIRYKDSKGQSKTITARDAQDFISEILPEDLFPYFFFKGENIERIGKEISDGKNSKNSEFVKAIKSMLGFNWLYQERDDLDKLRKAYAQEVKDNQSDEDIQTLQKHIVALEDMIRSKEGLRDRKKESVEALTDERNRLSNEIATSGISQVEEKQRRVLKLNSEIPTLNERIKKQKRDIFSKFSKDSFSYMGTGAFGKALEFLEQHGNIGEGIPGMDVTAIDYMLERLECICGHKFQKDDDTYKLIESKKEVVLPNNLNGEIEAFKARSLEKIEAKSDFLTSINTLRELLDSNQAKLSTLIEERQRLEQEIVSFPDIEEKKKTEQELSQQIISLHQDIGSLQKDIDSTKDDLIRANNEKAQRKVADDRLKRLLEYEWQVTKLHKRVGNTLDKMESEKRAELEEAINDIFISVFDLDIKVKLDENYGISLTTEDDEVLEDFEDSTSQDAIMAFAFIGGIIKLARNKAVPKIEDADMAEIDEQDLIVEPYPLVMDAPSSSFDIHRIESFCQIMPQIAEQVIFFIKDTDGLYVKQYIQDIIGKEYTFVKHSKHYTEIKAVN